MQPMIRMLRALPAAALVAMSIFGAMAPVASATTTCPSSPAPGSIVQGDLEVISSNNTCVLDHVTVEGSVTVDPNAYLRLQNGAVVTGGISVGSGGSTEVAFGSKVGGPVTLNGAFGLFIASSSLSRGLSGTAVSVDIYSSMVNGAVSVNAKAFVLCGSKVAGPVQSTGEGVLRIGDPPPDGPTVHVFAGNTGEEQTYQCDGNSITGSLTVDGGGVGSIEGNKISGPGAALNVRNTYVELRGNTVRDRKSVV